MHIVFKLHTPPLCNENMVCIHSKDQTLWNNGLLTAQPSLWMLLGNGRTRSVIYICFLYNCNRQQSLTFLSIHGISVHISHSWVDSILISLLWLIGNLGLFVWWGFFFSTNLCAQLVILVKSLWQQRWLSWNFILVLVHFQCCNSKCWLLCWQCIFVCRDCISQYRYTLNNFCLLKMGHYHLNAYCTQ